MIKILLWDIRRSRGLSLRELEKLTSISKSTLHNIEIGKVSPTLAQLELLASTMQLRINDFFESELK